MKSSLRILVVEDLPMKRQMVRSKLENYLSGIEISFEEADGYETARAALSASSFDFVILDLMIPAGGDTPNERWSKVLLDDILGGELCFPMHVFGLTEHEKLADSVRQYYQSNMFGLFVFKWEDDDWAADIASKIRYLNAAVENGSSYRLNSYDYDFLFITARFANEFEPVRRVLFGSDESADHPLWEDGAFFGKLRIEGASRDFKSALICIGETGLAPAASATTQAIQVLRPKYVVMLGMCAGFANKGLKLLDMIVARETACWQEGKSLESGEGEVFDPRGKVKPWSANLGEAIARAAELYEDRLNSVLAEVKDTSAYLKLEPKFPEELSKNPSFKVGLMVSGSSVVASEKTRNEVLERHPTALGLEMEAFAIYTAASMAMGSRPQYLTIKGVADLANGKKADDAQPLASELSARLFKKLMAILAPKIDTL